MEHTKVQLPHITMENYYILKKALLFYRNAGIEFARDGDFFMDMNSLIESIDDRIEIKKVIKN